MNSTKKLNTLILTSSSINCVVMLNDVIKSFNHTYLFLVTLLVTFSEIGIITKDLNDFK